MPENENPTTENQPEVTNPGGSATPDTTNPANTGNEGSSLESLPEWAQKELTRARNEAAKNRNKAKENKEQAESEKTQMLKNIAKALGLADDETPDPDKLSAQLTASQAEARERAVELAVYRAAGTAGADPDALLDSRTFINKVKNLNPSDDNFSASVAEAIAAAVESNPKLKVAVTKPAGKAGTEIAAGQSATRKYTKEEMKQIASDPAEYAKFRKTFLA